MEEFCKNLPKIELHAHLNGSLSKATLLDLGCFEDDVHEYQKLSDLCSKTSRTLDDCFELFKIAHSLTSSTDAVFKATQQVIEDFHNDNCVYLELRTTPRDELDMTKQDYILAVINAIRDMKDKLPIIVKLILCLDRRFNEAKSTEVMRLILDVHKSHADVLVGVDLCGIPSVGRFFSAEFTKARLVGLNVTLHCGEVPDMSQENISMLHFLPERISHGTCLHPQNGGNEQTFNATTLKNIPLEVCISSNVVTGTISSYEKHHVKHWIAKELPFCICTDDKGVFMSDLSNEYFLLHKHFNLGKEELYEISFRAIDYIFAGDDVIEKLRKQFEDWKLKNL